MLNAVIFDLDGVLLSTDEQHYQAWLQIAREEGIPFDRDINERLRGVSRMASLEIILERASKHYDEETKQSLASRKNSLYVDLIEALAPSDMLPGAMDNLQELRKAGVQVAIGFSSRNTKHILQRIGLSNSFDAIADGNDIRRSKPDPEVFLTAMQRMGKAPGECLVVEDADAGVEAAIAAGMRVIGVGSASHNKKAAACVASLEGFSILHWLRRQNEQS